MIVEIKIIGETLREESAIELIHNAVSPDERGLSQGNVFLFKLNAEKGRAWRVPKAICDILEIKP